MSFTAALLSYSDKNPEKLSKDELVLYDDNTLTIYDKFPKAKYHFLILLRRPFNGDADLQINSLDHLLSQSHDIINSVLEAFDRAITDAEQSIQEEQMREYGRHWTVNKGFHSVPSMDGIHLHVISNDLISDRLKNKKHYNSFHPTKSFFVHFDDVVKAVEDGSTDQLRRSLKAREELLKDPLQSHLDGKTYANIPKLKRHLVEHFESMTSKSSK